MNTLKQGDKVPNFSVKDQDGNLVALKDYKGKKLIVFFYPKASTPGCTAEACNLRDNYKVLQDKGFEILGVSADSEKRQTNFKNKYEFPFPLLADEDKDVINAFGVWGTKKFMGKVYDGIHRKTFLIDENGVVAHVIDKVKTKDHAAQILEIIE
ncbi:Thiol peroxidase, Bcp-type [Mesoflavibacter sp. HG96]|uniref:thioredoxin-dependent peroxiredoxin n=1 Tax=Mesoflavibacter profundi TaxID=2708110 RepID=A0ABT4RYR2_9FLAO|nr:MULTISPECIES: thioredoxin-dependent thiol peroxidase [Mesoflavibacter]MDA0176691.1 thioredoxin-dependent thiol peroxidase [Mesoflavibacter profundi]QIJ90348.1 Thiol peroxidase, Bcp-type [Mesoflavibacter sp. HG96]QIJ93076.1 Thiol peroxidase, Bcp-type [Mesoflavibacter sp. HG37]